MADVLREQAKRNAELLRRVAERDANLALPRAVKRRKRDDGEDAKGFSQPITR
jgi:hypothetical protein